MITIFDRIGRTFIRLFEQTGLWFDALWRTFTWMMRPPYDFAIFPQWSRRRDMRPGVFLTTMFTVGCAVCRLQDSRVHAGISWPSSSPVARLRAVSPVSAD